MELLGVLVETEHNAPTRAFLDRSGEGIERIAFTALDSAAGAEEIRARGYEPLGPTDFERPVTMPDGSQSAARFRIFQWPLSEAPAGLRIFACQHKTRETVWIPELMKHANGAKRLKQALVVSPEPAKDAAHLARLIDREVKAEPDGAAAVAIRFGSRRFHIPHQGTIGPALSQNLAGRIARARRCGPRPCDIRPRRCGESGRQLRCPQRGRRLRRASGCQWYAARFHPGLGLRRTFSLSRMLPRMPLGRKMMKITSSAP